MDPLWLPPDLPVPAALAGWTVVFAYPRTGRPGEELPGGEAGWNAIPGARGCTPELCGVRDDHGTLEELGARVFGLSTQDTDYQQEVVERLALQYPLLSDADLRFTCALDLPTFEVEGLTLIRRLTLLVRDGVIERVAYPVFPPDAAAAQARELLREAL